MAKLTLDGSVTLHKLQQFAEEAGDKSIRLKEKDGVKILYTSNKFSTGIKNFFTGQTDTRKAAAREELGKLMTDFIGLGGQLETGFGQPSILTNLRGPGGISGKALGHVAHLVQHDTWTRDLKQSVGPLTLNA